MRTPYMSVCTVYICIVQEYRTLLENSNFVRLKLRNFQVDAMLVVESREKCNNTRQTGNSKLVIVLIIHFCIIDANM